MVMWPLWFGGKVAGIDVDGGDEGGRVEGTDKDGRIRNENRKKA